MIRRPPRSTLFPTRRSSDLSLTYKDESAGQRDGVGEIGANHFAVKGAARSAYAGRSEEHTSELQSRLHLVCRLLLEKKKNPVVPLRILSTISSVSPSTP